MSFKINYILIRALDELQDRLAVEIMDGNPKRIDGLDINPADDGYIIYQPEQDRVHFLNPTAVLILELCNGKRSQEQIVELVKEAYGLPETPIKIVDDALTQMKAEGLLVWSVD